MNRITSYFDFDIQPSKVELENQLMFVLNEKFPQLICSSSNTPGTPTEFSFVFTIRHIHFIKSYIQLSFVELNNRIGIMKNCLRVVQNRPDVFFMDWVEHEIKCKLHRKYSVSCKKSSCWQVPRPLRSYCSYIDFLHGEYAFSYNSPSYENVIGSEVNYVLKNTAKDMINLFGWNHSALHVLHPKEAL